MQYIETEKFTDVYIRCKTLMPLQSKTITALNVLIYMMKSKTEGMDSKQKLTSFLSKTYSTKVSFGLSAYGDTIAVTVGFKFIRPDWIENENYTMDIVYILDQILFHSCLDEENFEEAKYLLKNRLLAIQDDPASLSYLYACKLANPKHSLAIPTQGRLEDLETLSLEDVIKVYDLYMALGKHYYVCGKLNETLYQYVNGLDFHTGLVSERTLLPKIEPSFKTWTKPISQSYITQIYATGIDTSTKDYYALAVMNVILGSGSKSLLFDEVREKHSLCYSIGATPLRYDGALMITTGTNKEDIDQVLNLIDAQIERLIHMDYDDIYLDVAKKSLKDMLISGMDKPSSLLMDAFLDDLLHRQMSVEEKIQKYEAITKDDVARIASYLHLVSCAIVKEDESHEV